jgi:nitroreductase
MTVLEAIQKRRSIRKYSERPIEEDKLLRVLEAARLSPSASNQQNWKFVVVRDPDKRAMLMDAALQQLFVGQAPVIIAACSTKPQGMMTCGQPRYTVDLSIATAYMILEAAEMGLGTCWLGRFDENKVKSILGIPEEIRVVTMFPLGYPDESPPPRSRKKLADIVCYDQYGSPE